MSTYRIKHEFLRVFWIIYNTNTVPRTSSLILKVGTRNVRFCTGTLVVYEYLLVHSLTSSTFIFIL